MDTSPCNRTTIGRNFKQPAYQFSINFAVKPTNNKTLHMKPKIITQNVVPVKTSAGRPVWLGLSSSGAAVNMVTGAIGHIIKTVAMTMLVCLGVSASAQVVGFTAGPGATYGGAANNGPGLNIGNTFSVSGSGITVLQLGAFNLGGDGLNAAHTVTLFDADTQTALGSVTVPAGTVAPLVNGYRFVSLGSPLYLPAGNYAVVAYQMNGNVPANDPYGDNGEGFNGSANLNDGGGIYSFTTSPSPAYPTSGSGNFDCASFTYTNVPTWIGGTSSDWSNPSNWQLGVEPSGITMVNTASGNLATVSTDVTANQPSLLSIGDGVPGIVDVQAGGNLTVNGQVWLGNTVSGQGTMNISDGTVTANDWYAVGRGGGQGKVNMTGGVLAVNNDPLGVGLDANTVGVFNQNGGVVNANDQFWVGNNDQGGSQNSATYNLTNGSIIINSWTVIGRHNTVGVLNISGGSLTKTSGNGDQMLIGVDEDSSTGIINQTGGAITNTASDTYLAGYNAGTGIWNLNGGYAVLALLQLCHNNDGNSSGTMNLNPNGTLVVSSVGYGGSGASTATFNFNGGTLVASGANATFMGGLTRANVRNGGAVINDGGFAIAISQPLLHSSIGGDNAADGGLTKNGTGTLELSGANTYTGDTTVIAGTLQLDQTGSSVGALRLANGTTLNLNFSGNYAVAHFYTNGVALPVGTYSIGNLPTFITGSGQLVVSSSISTGLWTGGGANSNWSTAGNWDQNAVPIFPIGLTFAGSTRLTNNNDLSSITASSITFDAAAGAFVLDGNGIALSGAIGFNGNPAAPITQTVNLNMAWGNSKNIDTPTNGNLSFGGNVTSAADTSLIKLDAGTLTLGGTNTITSWDLNGGTTTITGNTTINGDGSGRIYVGDGDSIALCNGKLVIQPGAELDIIGSYADDFVIGRDGGSGTVIQNGGTFIFNNNRPNMWIGATGNAATRSEYDMNGGLLDMSGNTLGVGLGAGVLITGVVNQVSGVITNVGNLWLGGATPNGYGAYNLSGGSIYIGTNVVSGTSGITTFSGLYAVNLGGGTIGAETSWSSPLNMNLTGVNGATTFDTAANTIALSGALSGTGGLTKLGSGTLDLASPGYTGDTTVKAGVLQLDATFSSLASTYRITNGAQLNLTYSGASILGHFYTNGVALPNGTYNAGNLPAFIIGSGALQVADVAFTNQPQNQVFYLNGNYHQSATFTSGTTGAAATYLWYLNGNPIPGATGNSVTLNNLQIASGGNLYVVATSGSGSVTSSVVALTIYGVNNNVFVYEGFAYPGSTDDSTPIDGSSQNGGTGWSGPWVGAGGTTGNTAVGLGNLTGGANVPAGFDSRSISNSLEDFGGSRVGRFFDTSTNSQLYLQGFVDANGNVGADGKTIYLSFLQQAGDPAGPFYELELKKDNLGDPGRISGIGNDTGGANVNLRAGGVNNYSLGTGDTNVDFYVVRIDYKPGNDDVRVYRNPTSLTEPAVPTRTVLGAADMSFNGLSVAAFNGDAAQNVDEIRLGATWDDAIGLAVSNLLPPIKTVNGCTVQFASTPGYSYRIQRAAALSGPWSDIDTNIAPANGFVIYQDTTAPSGKSFYRTVTP